MNLSTLRKKVAELGPLPEMTNPHSWLARRHNIRQMVQDEDAETFISWPTIQGTMFVGDGAIVKAELEEMKADNWPRWGEAIKDTLECGATRSKLCDIPCTGNSIHQAYHIMRFERSSGRSVETLDSIFEFGGGYGSMARVVYNLGFRGKYIVYDLPEFSLLQEFYLSRCGVPAEFVSAPAPAMKVDLFIALWSVGEIAPEERGEYFSKIVAAYHLIAYAEVWDGWENLAWFRGMAKHLKVRWLWRELAIENVPGSYYLMGEPRPVKESV